MFNRDRILKELQTELRAVEKYAKVIRRSIDDFGGEVIERKPRVQADRKSIDWDAANSRIRTVLEEATKPLTPAAIFSKAKNDNIRNRAVVDKFLNEQLGKTVHVVSKVKGGSSAYELIDKTLNITVDDKDDKPAATPPPAAVKPKRKVTRTKKRQQQTRDEKVNSVVDAMRKLNGTDKPLRASEVATSMGKGSQWVREAINLAMRENKVIYVGRTAGGDSQGKPAQLYKVRAERIHIGAGTPDTDLSKLRELM